MRLIIITMLISACFCASAQTKKIHVAQDGSGDYKTVQEAFDAIPPVNTTKVVIMIRKGIYRERLVLPAGKNYVHLIGEDPETTVLTYNNHTGTILPSGDTVNTYTSASFFIHANDFTAENLTFDNNAGFDAGQAVAVFANGDRLAFRNCRFTGFQDVLFCSMPAARQYFEKCYIEGTTDFIFGPATVLFRDSHIHSKKNSHVTAASTPETSAFGFVFMDCRLTADTSLHNVTLGRPWRPYASVTYIRCDIGPHIIPEGWNNWRNLANEKTARYAEYRSTGAGAKPGERVKWSRQLSDEEVKAFTIKNIFKDWIPSFN